MTVTEAADFGKLPANFLAAIVESSEDAIVGKTLDGIVTSWNRAAELIFGYRAAEMIGRPISILAAPGAVDEMPRILEAIRRGERIAHYVTERRRKDGRIILVALTVSRVLAHAFRSMCLSLAITCSIGLRSGEYFGSRKSFAPAARIAARTARLRWLPRLSMMTMSPGRSVGHSTVST